MAPKISDDSWWARLFGSRGSRGGSAKRPRNTANASANAATAKRRRTQRETGLRVFFDAAVAKAVAKAGAKAGGQSSAEQKKLAQQILLLVPNARTRYRTFLRPLEQKITRQKKECARAERIIVAEFKREEIFFRDHGFFQPRTMTRDQVIEMYMSAVVRTVKRTSQADLDFEEYAPIIDRGAARRLPAFLATVPIADAS